MKHDHASGITVLLLDANLHPCGLGALFETSQVLEPFCRAPRKRNGRRRRVQEVQPRLTDDREIERTVEGSLAGLLQIDCTCLLYTSDAADEL